MAIQKDIQSIQIPIGKVIAKFRSTIYYQNGNNLIRSKEFLEVGEQATLYSINGDIGEIGAGRFIKEVDSKHFNITYGTVQVVGENVRAHSKNGARLRHLKIGRTFNVIAIHQTINDVLLYQVNELEYLSSADEISFIMGYFLPLEDTYSAINNKLITHSKGESIPFKAVRNGMLKLLDNSLLDISNIKGQFI